MSLAVPSRWEHGSDAELLPPVGVDALDLDAHFPGGTFWHSGRDALVGLAHARRFPRVHLPSFYCQDVAAALRDAGHAVAIYADSPLPHADRASPTVPPGLRAGDAIVVSNTLGLRACSPFDAPDARSSLPAGVIVIEDHTHDPASPWARTTNADFAFASLRKWLPLPDGGVVWSRNGEEAPAPPALDEAHAAITLQRLSGMLLKARYLGGAAVDRNEYRALLVGGEGSIGRHAPAGMSPVARSLLCTSDLRAAREARRSNFARAARALAGTSGVRVAEPAGSDAVPFALTLLLPDRKSRDALRAALADARIFAAVLWPLDGQAFAGIPAAHVDVAGRVLSLHTDARYDAADMDRVAAAVTTAWEALR